MRRVAVTGIGCVSALGPDVAAFWSRCASGTSGIRMVERTRADDTVRFPGAPVSGFDPLAHFTRSELILRDPYAQYAVVAAREALRDAGLAGPLGERAAIALGTGGGGEQSREDAAVDLFVHRRGRCHPMLVPKTNNQASAGLVAREHGVTGPVLTLSTGCASATHAIAQAFDLIRFGRADLALTGGSEASVLYSAAKAFAAVRVLAEQTCRPFSRGRDGMALGEGAGVLVLEPLEAARARGARVYAELLGIGLSCDAGDPVHPSAQGPAQAMRAALRDAGVPADAVAHVNAHGTATVVNDRVESAALRDVFGDRAIPISATKSLHGHAFGGTGGLEAIAAILALHAGIAPPTAHFVGPDPDCDVDLVVGAPRDVDGDVALSNSFAFGGLNAVLAFGRTPDALRHDLRWEAPCVA